MKQQQGHKQQSCDYFFLPFPWCDLDKLVHVLFDLILVVVEELIGCRWG